MTRFDRLTGCKVGRKDEQNIHILVPQLFVGAAAATEVGAEDVPEAAEEGAPLVAKTAGTLAPISFLTGSCLINIVSL